MVSFVDDKGKTHSFECTMFDMLGANKFVFDVRVSAIEQSEIKKYITLTLKATRSDAIGLTPYGGYELTIDL